MAKIQMINSFLNDTASNYFRQFTEEITFLSVFPLFLCDFIGLTPHLDQKTWHIFHFRSDSSWNEIKIEIHPLEIAEMPYLNLSNAS